ncbi:MAG: aminotransferase DegT [Bacteroidetes bacterium 43-16]|nr:MAG: aminotransferase DegT [Bacteroidetes bacterium 43-16]
MIPIYKPYMPEGLQPELEQILYSGNLAFGKYGQLFEEALKSFLNVEYLLSTSSYNTAMLMVLSVLGLKAGDEVLASPVSCLASNQPFAVKGIKVVWVDVDPATGTMDIDDLRSKISNHTKAIFHNHFCGYVGDTKAVNALGQEFGIPVVDDAIEAFGSRAGNEYIGNSGADVTVFSFQTVRLPNTIDGGAIAFKNKELFDKARLIRDYGIERSKFRTPIGEISADCDIEIEGYAGMLSEVNAFIGYKQMDQLPHLLQKQADNAAKWDSDLYDKFGTRPLPSLSGNKPNYWVYGTLVNEPAKQEAILKYRNAGYYATGVHINNNVYSVFGPYVALSGVSEFMKRYVAIPCGWWL